MDPITLVLPYPVSANRYWATRVVKSRHTGRPMAITYVTPEAETYRNQVAEIARAQGIAAPFSWRVRSFLQLYPHRPQDWARRARRDPVGWDDDVQCMDLGNCEKVLSDALQGIVFTDDRWVWHMTKDRMEPDADGARVVLRVEPIARPQAPQAALFEGVAA